MSGNGEHRSKPGNGEHMEDGREQKYGSNISMFQTMECKKMLYVQFGGHVSKGQNVSCSFLSDRIMT